MNGDEEGTEPSLAAEAKTISQDGGAGAMLNPAAELPDVTLIEQVRVPTRIRDALNSAGLKSIGEVREASDATLLSLPDLGPGSLAFLREKLGLPSAEGVQSGT